MPKELFAPLRLSPQSEVGRQLIGLELPPCKCRLPRPYFDTGGDDGRYKIEDPGDALLVRVFYGPCAHVRARDDEIEALFEPGQEDELARHFLRLLARVKYLTRLYDPAGYEPQLTWRGPVWLRGRAGEVLLVGGMPLDVSRGVRVVAGERGWVGVYATRARAGLPLFHPDDDNPRGRNGKAAVQGEAGNRQGAAIEESGRRERVRVRKGEEPGHLDRLLARPAWWREGPASTKGGAA